MKWVKNPLFRFMSGQNYFHRQAEGVPRETVRESEREITVRRIAEPILSSLGLVLVDVELRGRGGNSLLRVVIEGPLADGQAPLDTRPVFVTRREWTFREAAKNPAYWLLLGSLMLGVWRLSPAPELSRMTAEAPALPANQ